jgi:hypothetical protein
MRVNSIQQLKRHPQDNFDDIHDEIQITDLISGLFNSLPSFSFTVFLTVSLSLFYSEAMKLVDP